MPRVLFDLLGRVVQHLAEVPLSAVESVVFTGVIIYTHFVLLLFYERKTSTDSTCILS